MQPLAEGGPRVVQRVLDVLDAFEAEPELGVSDLARRLGMDKSTASRQLAALARRDYVARDPTTGRFRLGIRLLRLGALVAARLDTQSLAFPFMVRLRDATGETVGLVIRQGLQRVCIQQVESQHQVRRTLPVGVPHAFYPGAAGKVFLAHLPPSEARPIVESIGARPLASGLVPNRRDVEAELRFIRAGGVSWSQEERVAGSAAAAFPVCDRTGGVVAALTVSIVLSRLTPEHRAHCIEQVRLAASDLSQCLGHVPNRREARA